MIDEKWRALLVDAGKIQVNRDSRENRKTVVLRDLLTKPSQLQNYPLKDSLRQT